MRISGWSSDVCSSDLIAGKTNICTGLFRPVCTRHWATAQLQTGATLFYRQRPTGRGQLRHRLAAVCQSSAPHRKPAGHHNAATKDRQSVAEGQSASVRVDHGGRRISKKKKNKKKRNKH